MKTQPAARASRGPGPEERGGERGRGGERDTCT